MLVLIIVLTNVVNPLILEENNLEQPLINQIVEKLAFSIYGDDHMVSISLPCYWMVDMHVAHQYDSNGFFYIKERGIDDSPVYIFVKLYGKVEGKDFNDFVNYMVDDLRNYQTEYNVFRIGSETYSTKMNKWNVEIYDVKIKSGNGHYQKIAYMVCENKYYIEIYIDCYEDTNEENLKYIEDFIECIHEIEYLNITLKEYSNN